MAVVTPYDEQEKQYLDIIEKATDISEVSAAKSQLNNLSAIKWDAVSLTDMATEIDSRFVAQDKGIYTSDYKNWKAIIDAGDDEAAREYAKNLLKTSDKIIFATTAKNKIAQINEDADELAGSNVVDTGGTGTATLSGGTAYTVQTDENGVSTLVPTENTVKVKEGTVIGGRVDTSQLEQDVTLLDRRTAWVDGNIEYHRQKTTEGFAVDSAILKRYYSVIDAEVYFGNEYVEDVHDINWAVQQNVMPLFGYNSYTYDEVARGNRVIVGNFTIAFTSPNYLFSILKAANKANINLVENMASYDVPKLSSTIQTVPRNSAYGTRETGHNSAMWPQTFDIDIIMGEKTGVGDPVHVIILGAVIQHCQTVLSASAAGTPPAIMEQYSFIAQDIHTSVLNATGKTETQSNGSANSSNAVNTGIGDITSIHAPAVTQVEATALGKTVKELQAERDAEARKKYIDRVAEKEADAMKEQNNNLSDAVYNYMKVITDKGGTSNIGGDSNTPTYGATMRVRPILDSSATNIIGYQLDLAYPNATTSQAARAAKQQMNTLTKIANSDKYTGWDSAYGQANDGRTLTYIIAKNGAAISPSEIQAVTPITTAPVTQSSAPVPETAEVKTDTSTDDNSTSAETATEKVQNEVEAARTEINKTADSSKDKKTWEEFTKANASNVSKNNDGSYIMTTKGNGTILNEAMLTNQTSKVVSAYLGQVSDGASYTYEVASVNLDTKEVKYRIKKK